jgi:hypothetical protein
MTGPKAFPTTPVPRFWIANKPTKMTRAIGIVYGLKMLVATFRPSTALRTEISINEGCTEQARDNEPPTTSSPTSIGHRHQRENRAFTVVVSAHYKKAVLNGYREDQRPKD